MTERDKHIAQKRKEIEKIAKQQFRLIGKAANIAGAPYKRPATFTKRMVKVAAMTMQIRALEMQKQMIIAQPIPNYVPGGVVPGGMAIVGETGPELILTNTGNIFIPGEIQTCPIGEMVHVPINWKTDKK